MNILFAAAEAAPFCATGGLGDVIGALPKAISQLGNTVSVIIPKYRVIPTELLAGTKNVCELSFSLGWRKTGARIFVTKHDGIDFYLVENDYYFDRPSIYGNADDGERFAFFSMAIIEFVRSYLCDTQILHTNDWHTALCNVYLKTLYSEDTALNDLKNVFTIHNVEFQGKFDPYLLGDIIGLDERYKHILEYDGCLNLMKGALVCADRVTVVSQRYANELEYDYFGFGLSPIIKQCSGKLVGILNGIDKTSFSPQNSTNIFYPYGKRDCISGKEKNKHALFKELGITQDKDRALAVMITRLTDQKGIDLIIHILNELLEENINMIILGSGDKKYEEELKHIASLHDNFYLRIGFDRNLSKKLYAAADIFIMPSKSEPCGLSQMIACSYGTVPVVRSVGGLSDTIIPYGQDESNGFTFNNYNAHELLYTIKHALSVKQNKREWRALMLRCMSRDFSWETSAVKYENLYKEILYS